MSKILETLLYKLKNKNIDEYEIIEKKIEKKTVKVENGKIKDFKHSVEDTYTLRVIKDKKIGFTYFTNSELDFASVIDKAVSLSAINTPDKFNSFYDNSYSEPDAINLYNQDIDKISENEQFEKAYKIEEKAYKSNSKIINVKDASVFKGDISIRYINSHNIDKSYRKNYCGGTVVTVAKDNESSMVGYEHYVSPTAKIDEKYIANSAANKAVRMLNAEKGKSIDCPVIIENELFADILTIIVPSFYIENIDKQKSLFIKHKKGDKIASKSITLIDNPLDNKYIGAAVFDDEGAPVSVKTLINYGELNDYLSNLYYSKKYNMNYAGNSFLPGFKNSPVITYTNLIFQSQNNNLDETVSKLNKGIYLTNLMGLHLADPISGDFSLGGEGILIENGEFAKPVKEFIITGNIKDILKNCVKIFDDSKVNGNIVAPSIMVEGLVISGN